jgi:RNA polymerase sigma-70 factor (ECF subfamily)
MPRRNSVDLKANESVLRTFAQFDSPSELAQLGTEAIRAIKAELKEVPRNEAQVQDVFQDALLTTFKALQGKEFAPRRLRSFFLATCRRKATEVLRNSARRELGDRQAQEWLTIVRGEATLPQEPLADERLKILEALSRLSDRHRRIIELIMIENLSDEEIGSALGFSPAALRTAKHRAIRALRDVLKSDVVNLIRSRMARPATAKENKLWQDFKAEIDNDG